MRLVAQAKGNWQYALSPNEAALLTGVVKKFPFMDVTPAQISKVEGEPQTAEREKLLNESMAEHRKELTKLAVNLLGDDKWQRSKKAHLLTLDAHAREILLQILNDIRVGCWRALGA